MREYAPAIEAMTKELLDIEVLDGDRVRTLIGDFEKEHDMPTLLSEIEDELAHHDTKKVKSDTQTDTEE